MCIIYINIQWCINIIKLSLTTEFLHVSLNLAVATYFCAYSMYVAMTLLTIII